MAMKTNYFLQTTFINSYSLNWSNKFWKMTKKAKKCNFVDPKTPIIELLAFNYNLLSRFKTLSTFETTKSG